MHRTAAENPLNERTSRKIIDIKLIKDKNTFNQIVTRMKSLLRSILST